MTLLGKDKPWTRLLLPLALTAKSAHYWMGYWKNGEECSRGFLGMKGQPDFERLEGES